MQVWFKNRRAKCRQIQKATEQTSKSAATSSTGSGSGGPGKNCSSHSSTLKRSGSVASRGSPPSPSVGRPNTDRKPTADPARRPSSPTPTSLHDSCHHHHHHHLGASGSSSSYLPPHLPTRSQQSPSPPPPRVVFAPVSSPSSRFWKHSASLGDLATDFGGCFAQRAAAAAAAAGYASYGVGPGSSGSSVGLSPTGYSTSPHSAPYYGSQVWRCSCTQYVTSGVTRRLEGGGQPQVTSSRGWHPNESLNIFAAEFREEYWINDHLERQRGCEW